MVLSRLASRSDVRALQGLASRRWPVGWHPGGLGWALARGQLADDLVLFRDGAGIAGWAGRGGHDDGELLAQVDPGRSDVADALVEWLVEDGPAALHIEVYDGDASLERALREVGFAPDPGRRSLGMFRPTDTAVPAAPSGYAVRAVRQDETKGRVDVHRAAWRPASLPWSDGRTVDPAAESSFTLAAYAAVRATWLYDPHLDLVAVAPDGSLAGCCIVWFDPANGTAEIEPLGIVPEHRRRGLAAALCHEAAARVAARGGRQLFINTGPRDEYPAPAGAYLDAGFAVRERATTYVLRRSIR